MRRKTKNNQSKYLSEKLINFRWYISITQSVTNLYFSMKTLFFRMKYHTKYALKYLILNFLRAYSM